MVVDNLKQSTPRSVYLLLLVVVAAGLILRTWNIDFDKGVGSHPDERSTACFRATSIHLPATWQQFTDPRLSPLNPLWDLQRQEFTHFTYGHFPLYLGVAMGNLLHWMAPAAAALGFPDQVTGLMARADRACDALAVAGRLVIAMLDTLTIALLFFLGRRLYGPWVGLLAATFYAFTAQAIQLSHFFAMDPASTTFTVLAVLGGVLMVQERSLRAALLTGLGIGLAVASKFSALPLLAVPVAAAGAGLLAIHLHPGPDDGRAQFRLVVGAPLAMLTAFLAFLVTSPYAVLDWENFIQATLVEQGQMVRGVADFPFTRQYRNTTPYLYFIQQQIQWGLGWALGLLALAGSLVSLLALGRAGMRLVRAWVARAPWPAVEAHLWDELVVWSWVLPYFGLTGAFLAKFNRYMSPVLPFVLLFGAGLIWRLWQVGRTRVANPPTAAGSLPEEDAPVSKPAWRVRLERLARSLALLLAVTGVVAGLFWSVAYVNGVYNRDHTWITASRWIYENVPDGSTLLWEVWDDPLPKTLRDEPGMDMATHNLRNIDWSPYEEDTADKFEIMKAKLREADYVVYSSKRIYDSVDELPERYPMTTRYYDAMWDGSLGFEMVLDLTSPPRLFGVTFQDRQADESWSLYDHPQVTIFRKVRNLDDAEYAALFDNSWEEAVHWYRGPDSMLDPLLTALGLGSTPDSEHRGLVSRVVDLLSGTEAVTAPPGMRRSLDLDRSLHDLTVVDDYRWNDWASARPWAAVLWWWMVLGLLGMATWPLLFGPLTGLRDRGYFFGRVLGWLLAGWLLWWGASLGVMVNNVGNAWLAAALLVVAGAGAAYRQRRALADFLRTRWPMLLVGEVIVGVAYLLFVLVRMANPDLWQPWLGGEKFMEMAFLNGILRSPTFPPVDPHFAGGYINYYYFGIYLVAYLIKLTGIYAEVAFNLAIPTLFALTVLHAFAIAYSAWRPQTTPTAVEAEEAHAEATPLPEEGFPKDDFSEDDFSEDDFSEDDFLEGGFLEDDFSEPAGMDVDGVQDDVAEPALSVFSAQAHPEPDPPDLNWRAGLGAALLAPLLVALVGNLDGFAQLVRSYAERAAFSFETALPAAGPMVRAAGGLGRSIIQGQPAPMYDFWGPSRVIPFTINEFPFWSFLFADLHPHLIGIPLALFFLGLLLALMYAPDLNPGGRQAWRCGVPLLALFALMLGTLASVNLWELPTYAGLGVLAYLVVQFRAEGRIHWGRSVLVTLFYAGGAYLAFWPFFHNYVTVGAAGLGLVKAPDPLGVWLLVWGLLGFITASWLFYSTTRRARPASTANGRMRPAGVERFLSLALRKFDRLPRLLDLHRRLVRRPTFAYQAGVWLLPVGLGLGAAALLWGRAVLALCMVLGLLGFLLLWRRGRAADPAAAYATLLVTVGFAILAGTQVVYLRDFLSGGDWYRMNTLFKFFNQVWVIWAVAAAVVLPRLWGRPSSHGEPEQDSPGQTEPAALARLLGRWAWRTALVLLLGASLVYPLVGTPARLQQRFIGWQPPFGTLNGLDYARQGVYTWPEDGNAIELRYDWQAIQWLLENVVGNTAIMESAEVDYYRAGGTRIASLTGLSGLRGMHASEQRYPDLVGARDRLHREFWSTPDMGRAMQILEELDVGLVYVGQLEMQHHPQGVEKVRTMAEAGLLTPIYENERVTIYAVPDLLQQRADGRYAPA